MLMRTKSILVACLILGFEGSGTALAQQRSYKNDGAKPFCLTSVGWQGFGPSRDRAACRNRGMPA